MIQESQHVKQIEEIELILVSLLTDFCNGCPGYGKKDFYKDIATLKRRLSNEGLFFATRTLPILSKGLLDHLEGRVPDYSGFGVCKYGYPNFLKGLFRLAYNEFDNNHEDHVYAIKAIYQIADGFKKLKGPYRQDELKNQLNDFIAVDQSLPEIDCEDTVLIAAKDIITNIFKPVDDEVFELFKPRPGPGATNEPLKVWERWKPNKLFASITDVFNPLEWFYATYAEANWDASNLIQKFKDIEDVPTSRFKFVPKKVGTARGICIEHNDVQYLQQGVKNFLYPYVERHPKTKGQVNFASQDFNAEEAIQSSLDKKNATLDMSAASDRISRDLVRFLFSDLPNLGEVLLCLSTPIITFDGVLQDRNGKDIAVPPLHTRKYAPMGSGLCFPIMALVHFAILKATITLYHDDPQCKILVYGDDIIIPSEYVDSVYEQLPRFGMKFNEGKSFVNGHFRESCGTHAYKGNVITPRYFKYLPSDEDPRAVLSTIAVEQSLHEDGFSSVSSCIRTVYGHHMPFVPSDTNYVGWKRSDLSRFWHLQFARRRWNDDFQKWEYRIKCFHVEKSGKPVLPFGGTILHRSFNIVEFLTIAKSNWNERDAYLRALLVNAEDHTYHFENTGIIKFLYNWA